MVRRRSNEPFPDEQNPEGFGVWVRRLCEYMAARNYSEHTIAGTEKALRYFVEWALDRGLERPDEVTKPILEHYQRWLFHYRKTTGKPLTFASQRERLQKIKNFYKWLARQNAVPSNPAADLELPRVERRLPRAILTRREVEKVFSLPDVTSPEGFRDRTLMEVLYSTGVRRHEAAGLELFDINKDDRTVTVRLGKGKKDRVVPIGRRALDWVEQYVHGARADLILRPSESVLFVGADGQPFDLGALTQLLRVYIGRAKLGKQGACHIFRHSMATHMLEGGADIRHIQEILGHAETSTTALYTRVSVRHLRLVHDATHPMSGAVSPDAGQERPSQERASSDRATAVSEAQEGARSDFASGASPADVDSRQLLLFPDKPPRERQAQHGPDVQKCLSLLAAEQAEEDEAASPPAARPSTATADGGPTVR